MFLGHNPKKKKKKTRHVISMAKIIEIYKPSKLNKLSVNTNHSTLPG
jgi:hypothetical protein